MLYGFIGNDTQSARRDMREMLSRFSLADSPANISRFDDQNFDPGSISEALFGQSLFGGSNIIVLDGLLDHPNGEKFYLEHAFDGENIFIIREGALKKNILGHLEKFGEIRSFILNKNNDTKRTGDFALANALISRDKKLAWVEFEKSRRRGEAMEAVHGMVFWAFKTMFSVASLPKNEVIASGVKEFTYSKVKSESSRYQIGEIVSRLDTLKDIYHQSHRGESDMEFVLEQFILKI